jgi:anti-sigma factor RsiW
VTDATGHLPYWTLEQLAEGGLSHVERGLAEQHLRSCTHCTAELQGARSVIAALERLPALVPSADFAERVMARVHVAPAVAAAPAVEARRRWLPALSRGWMTLLALILLPLPVLAGVGTWVSGNPVSGMGALWGVVRGWASDVSFSLLSEGTEVLIRTGLFQWGADILSGIPGPSVGGVPALLLLVAAAVPVSAWAMARLLRAPTTGLTHA